MQSFPYSIFAYYTNQDELHTRLQEPREIEDD